MSDKKDFGNTDKKEVDDFLRTIIKQWIAHIFNIQRTFIVCYQKDGKKYLRIVVVKNRRIKELNFLVEHLLNENLEVTEETLQKEKTVFTKVSSNK